MKRSDFGSAPVGNMELRLLGERRISDIEFFQLVSSRYEHASIILTSNLPFARWEHVINDQAVASVLIDRIVHHAEVLTLEGNSCRLKDTKVTLPSEKTGNKAR